MARRLQVTTDTVRTWRRRFLERLTWRGLIANTW
ncbi:hypothetical protein [Streptomyces chryseus]